MSNVDFDMEHPAGSSLGDLVHLLSISPIRFIQSNYRETYDWNAQYAQEILNKYTDFPLDFCYSGEEPVDAHHHLVYGILTELRQNDLQLLGRGYSNPYSPNPSLPYGYFFGYLTFEKEPDMLGVHELTVTVRLADGRILSQTIEKTFE